MPGEFQTAIMDMPTGTAHAVRVAIEALPKVDYIISLLGDSPLLTGEIVQKLYDHARMSETKLTLLTCKLDDAASYGRIDRDDRDRVTAIIEKDNDDPAKRTGRTEINSGIMVLQRDWALDAIRRLKKDEGTGEYLLTDLVGMAVAEHRDDEPWPVATYEGPEEVSEGINTREQQAKADSTVRKLMRKKHMDAGVTMVGPETIFIDETVIIGQDTTLYPGTILMGNTTIGQNCHIGPYAVLINATVADGVTIRQSTIEDSTIRTGADAGPYAHIRCGSDIGEDVHIGNFAEVKNSTLARGAKSGHFSYLGDATIGERTNIGAGTITANYDGTKKNHTEIGSDVFIGSDTVLVAPVEVESTARTGAGSVVTKNVKSGQTVVGIPARPIHSRSGTEKE
jgi:bifunctional UDP-N-acetylglucosamine pyrophosphorylase/glucosamine-1-phosphate N-acetyltransferase